MADISQLGPLQDFGNLSSNYAANTNLTQAQTGQANANTQVLQQDAQSKQMQNQIQKARMNIVLKALSDYRPQSDDSGETNAPGGNGQDVQATPGTKGVPVSANPTDPKAPNKIPSNPAEPVTTENWYDHGRVDAGLRQKYFVNPAGNQQEINAVTQAAFTDPKGDLGLLEQAKQTRQLNVDHRLAASQNGANELYETMTNGVVGAPDGRALDALEAISPQAAAQIRKMIPDDMEEDQAARSYASHIANTVHQYSGRKVVFGNDGLPRDETTGNPITGGEKQGMTAEQIATLAAKGNELTDVKQSDGSTIQMPVFRAQGSPTLSAWITKVADKNNVIAASPSITGAPKAIFQSNVKQAVSKVGPPTAPAQQAPQQGPAGGGQAPQQQRPQLPAGVKPNSPVAPGTAAMQSRLLIDPSTNQPVNLDAMPQSNLPPVRPMATPNPQEAAQIDAFKSNFKEMQTDAMRKLQETNQADTLLTPFQQKLNSVNPRDVGPGSKAYQALLDVKAAVTGKAPGDLVDMGVLDKFANQLGVQNVRALLSGQRITNQEMMSFLTRASASVTQPLDVMRTIVSFQKANNDFDRRLATTQLAGLTKHVDPAALQALENYRTGYVEQSMAKDGFPASPTKPMPTGAKLTQYATTHFGGDTAKATQYLQSHGYTQ